jgi:hypothetical protein
MIIGISGKKQSGKNTVALIWQYLYDYYYSNYTHPITVEDFKEYVKNNHHLKSVWIQKSFAHKIKQITCILLGCTMEQLEDPIFKETPLGEEWWCWKIVLEGGYGTHLYPYSLPKPKNIQGLNLVKMTPRMLMQMLGTEFGRNMVHPNIWVNATFTNFGDKEEWFRKETGLTRIEYLTKNGHSNEYKTLNEQFFKSLPNWIITDVRFFNEAKAIKDRGGILIRVNREGFDNSKQIEWSCDTAHLELCKLHSVDPEDDSELWDGENYKEIYQDEFNKLYDVYWDLYSQHSSETALDDYKEWDYVIDNNYSLSELILRVRQIMFKEGIIYE